MDVTKASAVLVLFAFVSAPIATTAQGIPPPETQGLPRIPPSGPDPTPTTKPAQTDERPAPSRNCRMGRRPGEGNCPPPAIAIEQLRIGATSKAGNKSGRGNVPIPPGYKVCSIRTFEVSHIGPEENHWSVTTSLGAKSVGYNWSIIGNDSGAGRSSIYFDLVVYAVRNDRSEMPRPFERGEPPIDFEPPAGFRCGDQLSARSGGTSAPTATSATASSSAADFIQLWDFGFCESADPLAKWRGFRNNHQSLRIEITYEVSIKRGVDTSVYNQTKLLRAGESERIICSYSPGDASNGFGTRRDIRLLGASFR